MMDRLRESGANTVQVFGEALPCQSLKYGFVNPTMRVYRVSVDGADVPRDQLPEEWSDVWVPVLYEGVYERVSDLKKLALGDETLSGESLHIKEGVVIKPRVARRAADGTWLQVKVINPAYKETGEEFN